MQHLLLKSPGESAGGVTKAECKRRYDEDYAYASAIYLSSMLLCSCATGGLVYVFVLLVLLLAMTMQQLLLIVVIMIVCQML